MKSPAKETLTQPSHCNTFFFERLLQHFFLDLGNAIKSFHIPGDKLPGVA